MFVRDRTRSVRRRRWVVVAAALVVAALMPAVSGASSTEPALAWAHNTGGLNADQGRAVAVDAAGNVYVTGYFSGEDVDFDPGPGTHLLSSNGGNDIFVAKYDPAGNLAWAHGIGSATQDQGLGVAVDAAGNVYVTGFFTGANVDFDPGPDTHPLSSTGDRDIFVAKYDTDGALEWAHGTGGTGIDEGAGVAVDAAGNVYLTGSFSGANVDFDPGPGTHALSSNGILDVFVAKYDTDGALEWAHNTGGADFNEGKGVAVDAADNVYVTGYFMGINVDFDPGPGTHHLSSNGNIDMFVAKYDPAGNLTWAHNTGGTAQDAGQGVAVDADGNVYVTGAFSGANVDFDPGPGTHLLSSNGGFDAFVAKYDPDGALEWAHSTGDAAHDEGLGVAVDAAGNVYVTGHFSGANVDFDPGPDEHLLSSNGSQDVFVATYDPDGSLAWAHNTGGANSDIGWGVAMDAAGNVYATGGFSGANVDFDPGPGTHLLSSNGNFDAFVAKYAQPGVIRLAGVNRFETAAAVAAHHYGSGATAAFIATGLNFPDALTGAGPAGLNAAPLLLTGSIPQATADALDALGLSEIIVLGGPAAVSAADATALGAWGAVTRLEGPTRYETAAAISQYAYPDGADVVVVATGENFPDALAAASAATTLGGPVLLTPTGTLHQAAADEITRLNPSQIIVAGGPAAISDAVFGQLSAMKPTIRIEGPNRYDTAVAISQHTFTNPDLVDRVYIAVGTNFPDALAGAATAAAAAAPVLLTTTNALPQAVIDEITRLGPSSIFILGGTAVISQAVENQLVALLP